MNSMVPTFFVLGGQRCGTTWLHQMLVEHPDVFVLKGKEPDFFYRVSLTESFESYEDLFKDANPSQARGDMSVNYCMLTTPVIRQVHRILPHLKFILTLRNPIDRSWSQLKLIHDLMDIRDQQLKELGVSQILQTLGQCRVTRRSDFLAILKRWQSVYSPEDFHLSLFEQVRKNPKDYLDGAFKHLGVDPKRLPTKVDLKKRVHAGGSEDMPDLVRWWLCRRWLEPVKALNQHLDGMVEHWVTDIERDLKALSPPTGWNPLRYRIKTLPERVAYAIYDKRRERKLVSRLKMVPTKSP